MRYLIAGAGPAGIIAAETLRGLDKSADISVVGEETESPYSRMALPYLLAENINESGTHLRRDANTFDKLSIELLQKKVNAVDAGKKNVTLSDNTSLSYDKLLIATGSHTVRPPVPGMDLSGIENCWTLADARRIAAQCQKGSRVVLMGAGFIGCIVLEALVARGTQLTVIEMADRMLPRMMDDAGGNMIKRWCESKGVTVLTDTRVEGVEQSSNSTGKGLALSLSGGDTIEADLVVCATGVRPNTQFLEGTGVETDTGILVDHYLQTNVADIYAAGDVAQGPDISSGAHEVHAIQPTASEHGRIAAYNMAGNTTFYRGSLSMNVLNTLGLVSSSFGLWDGIEGGEQSIARDDANSRYLRLEFQDDRLVGALALGLTQHVGVIRGLMQTGVPLGRQWKERLMQDPNAVMYAYLDRAQGASPLASA